MKTKHYTLKKMGGVFMLLLLSINSINAQFDEVCIVENIDLANFIVTPEEIAAASDMLPVVFNMAFWQLNDPNGYYPNPITEEYALTVIAEMNMEYNQWGIFFKYRGVTAIDSPPDVVHKRNFDSDGDGTLECTVIPGPDPDGFMSLSFCQSGELNAFINDNGYRVMDAFNVYIPAITTDYGGSSSGWKLTFNRNGVTGAGMIHEIGHSFGLHHLHGKGNNNTNWRHPTDSSRCEHVTRDESITTDVDPVNYFNAFTRADDIKDTASSPNFRVEYCHFNGLPDADCSGTSLTNGYVSEDCTHESEISKDCAGMDYDIFEADIRNYMAYSPNSCKDRFSPDQVAKMQGKVTGTSLDYLKAELSSLYEPYRGEYYFAGPLPSQAPLFQPGFDYKFVKCGEDYPQPSDYDDTTFYYSINSIVASYNITDDIPYSSIIHPNGSAIVIEQVNTSLGYTNVRRCYDNKNRSPLGGSVTKFNDNVFNYNVTVTQKDSTGINQETLVDDLPSGLYKIEKQFEDGSIEQTIISKGNND